MREITVLVIITEPIIRENAEELWTDLQKLTIGEHTLLVGLLKLINLFYFGDMII